MVITLNGYNLCRGKNKIQCRSGRVPDSDATIAISFRDDRLVEALDALRHMEMYLRRAREGKWDILNRGRDVMATRSESGCDSIYL